MKPLNSIAYNAGNIIGVLKKPEFSIETKKGFYTALVKFLSLLGITEETKKEAYTNYKAFLDTLPKKIQYAPR